MIQFKECWVFAKTVDGHVVSCMSHQFHSTHLFLVGYEYLEVLLTQVAELMTQVLAQFLPEKSNKMAGMLWRQHGEIFLIQKI